jgi:acetoin utilization protein AcuB
MSRGKLVGVITDRDLKRASASDATTLEIHELLYLLSKIKVKDIMTKNPTIVSPDFSIEETAQILIKNKISAVPVIDDKGQVVGVITQTDLFRVLTTLTGVDKRGLQFAFIIVDRPRSIQRVTDIIREYNGRLMSILTSYEKVPEGSRGLYIRVYGVDRAKLPQLKKDLQEVAKILYMIDHKREIREVYSSP